MGFHRHSAGCLCAWLLILTTAAGAWREWTTPQIALEDLTAATAERMEAAWLTAVTPTSRTYNVVGTVSNTAGPLRFGRYEQDVASRELIHYADQTNRWTNVVAGVTNVLEEVLPLYRLDWATSITTNWAGTVETNRGRWVVWTNVPNPVTRDYVTALDSSLLALAPWYYAIPTNLSQATSTNWTWIPISGNPWDAFTGSWVEDSYNYSNRPAALSLPAAFRAAGLPVMVTTGITDRGASWPRTVTNTASVQGWTVGQFSAYRVTVTNLTVQPRYVTSTVERGTFRYAVATGAARRVLAIHQTARDATDAKEARGFVATLDGLLTNSAGGVGGRGWYIPDAAPVWIFDRLVSGGEVALSNAVYAGANEYGCFPPVTTASPPATGEIVPAASWRTTLRDTRWMTAGRDLWFQKLTNAWLVTSLLTTSEILCAAISNEPAALPQPLDVTVVGTWWRAPSATQGWTQITHTQTLSVTELGTQALERPLQRVERISARAAEWGTTNHYPKDGLRLAVEMGGWTQCLVAAGTSNAVPWMAWEPALADRRLLLEALQITQGALRSNAVTYRTLSMSTSTAHRTYTENGVQIYSYGDLPAGSCATPALASDAWAESNLPNMISDYAWSVNASCYDWEETRGNTDGIIERQDYIRNATRAANIQNQRWTSHLLASERLPASVLVYAKLTHGGPSLARPCIEYDWIIDQEGNYVRSTCISDSLSFFRSDRAATNNRTWTLSQNVSHAAGATEAAIAHDYPMPPLERLLQSSSYSWDVGPTTPAQIFSRGIEQRWSTTDSLQAEWMHLFRWSFAYPARTD